MDVATILLGRFFSENVAEEKIEKFLLAGLVQMATR